VPEDQAAEASLLLEELRRAEKKERPPQTPEQTVSRAFRIAIIGLFLCPGPMHCWSCVVAVRADPSALSPSSRRTRILTIAIDVAVLAIGALVAMEVWEAFSP
jgi:hypothetical protein